MLPYFVLTHVPAGLAGLIIAGVLAAAMSAIDSGVNSIATVTVVDGNGVLLGSVAVTGTFTVNGKQITLATSDTLQAVFDKISTATGGAVGVVLNEPLRNTPTRRGQQAHGRMGDAVAQRLVAQLQGLEQGGEHVTHGAAKLRRRS